MTTNEMVSGQLFAILAMFKQLIDFDAYLRFRILYTCEKDVFFFITKRHHLKQLKLGGAINPGEEEGHLQN